MLCTWIVTFVKIRWRHGRVTQIWYTEPGLADSRPQPYQIRLLNSGKLVWCPIDDDGSVMAATAENFEATGAVKVRKEEKKQEQQALQDAFGIKKTCPCCQQRECRLGRMRKKLASRQQAREASQCGVHMLLEAAKAGDELVGNNNVRASKGKKRSNAQRKAAQQCAMEDSRTVDAGSPLNRDQLHEDAPNHDQRRSTACGCDFDGCNDGGEECFDAIAKYAGKPRISLRPDIRVDIIQMCGAIRRARAAAA